MNFMPVQVIDFQAETSYLVAQLEDFNRAVADLTANGRQPTAEELIDAQNVGRIMKELLQKIDTLQKNLVARWGWRWNWDFFGKHITELKSTLFQTLEDIESLTGSIGGCQPQQY